MTEPSPNSPGTDRAASEARADLDSTRTPLHHDLTPPGQAELNLNFDPPEGPGEVGTLGRYRVIQKLGRGGMGAVFLAHDTKLARRIALKVMLPQYAADTDARERFLREARTAAMVRSNHVVTIYDVGEERGIPFIAMEYLRGYPLDKFLKEKGELPLAHVLRVARETAIGLAAAHELGLIHRDVKPANLWLESPKGLVKLLDFGLARAENEDTELTGTGVLIGTPAYMSPEQGRGDKVDHRSDLFSLGVMLYRLCTGQMPFKGKNTMAALTSLAMDTPPAPRQLNPKLPEALEALVLRLLAKNLAERFQTAREVADAIGAIENAPSGELPVVVAVPVQSLVVGAQAQNVWDGIDASGSEAVPLASDASTEIEPSPKPARTKPHRPASKWPTVLAGGVLLAAVAVLAAVAFVLIKPAKGTLVVENEDSDAELRITKDGEVIRERTRDREIKLEPGRYTVVLVSAKPGTTVAPDTFEIIEKKETRIRLVVERPRPLVVKVLNPSPQPQPSPPQPPADPSAERDAAKLAISLGGTVRVHNNPRTFRDGDALPKGPFSLAQIYIDSRSAPRNMADSVLANFKDCHALTGLLLYGCTVTDAGLANFKGNANLTELALYGSKVSDAGIANFKECKFLQTLDLDGTGVTETGLAYFKDCEKLSTLRLTNMKVLTAAGLAHFKDRPNLQNLSLAQTPVSTADVAVFAGCKGLKELDLSGTQVGDDALPHFKECADLRSVSLARTKVADGGLAVFKDSRTIRELDLSGTAITGDGLAHLGGCSKLGILRLAGVKLTDDSVTHLKTCTDLHLLNLQETPVGDPVLKHLEGFAGLQVLQLQKTKVTTEAVRQLAEKLPNCRIEWSGGVIETKEDPDRRATEWMLSISAWPGIFVNGKEVPAIRDALPRERFELRTLNVNRFKEVNDEALACLKGVRHLTFAQITNVPATDKALTYLTDCKNLETLILYASKVTDEGLKTLAGFKELRYLDIAQLPVTEPAVRQLAEALPRCVIRWNGGTIEPK